MAQFNRFSLVSLLALGIAMPAFAQVTESGPQTAPAGDDKGAGRSERDVVIITANKREESVQDVAVAVTAISAETKQQLGIITVTDLTNVTPGLSYTPGNERVTLRGVGRLSNSIGADPGVANYNDGIYTSFAVLAGKDPLMINRVEVLRGPQGTLYGRNGIGGAINTISKRPSDDFTVDTVLGAGNFDYVKAGAAISGPLTDWLRYRLVGFRESRDGIDHNYGANEEVGWEINDKYLELQLEGDISDRWSWWFKTTESGYDKAGPPGGRTATFSTAPYLTAVPSQRFIVTGSVFPNGAYGFTGDPSIISVTQGGNRQDNPYSTNGEHAYNTNIQNTAHLNAYDEYILESTYSTDLFDIKYTGGYTFFDYTLNGDSDGTPIKTVTYNAITSKLAIPACAAVPIGVPTSVGGACVTGSAPKTLHPGIINEYGESRAFFSNEINLISTTEGPLQWIAGLYQYQENSKQPGSQDRLTEEPLANFYVDSVLGVVANPDRETLLASNTSFFNAYGVYGQIDYSVTDQLKATLGVRWSRDTKESEEEIFVSCYIICGFDLFNYTRILYGAVVAADPTASFDSRGHAHRRLKDSWEAVTGTAGLEYRPFDDTLLFGKYSRGYKAGGFNNLGFAALPYTKPEYVDSYEAGWKQEWSSIGLTTNASLFLYNYTDAQAPLTVVVTDPTTLVQQASTQFVNLPEVETTGFELESNWNPIDDLNIGFTYAYLNAEVTKSDVYSDATRNANCIVPLPAAPGTPGPCNVTRTQLVDPLRNRSVEGNQLSQSPENKVAINASYRLNFEDGSYFLPTISYSWRDAFYDTFFNNDNEKSPAYFNLDARLNWYSSDESISLTAWVRNLTDEDQTTSIGANGFRVSDLGRYQTYSFAPPRTFGVDLRFHFQ